MPVPERLAPYYEPDSPTRVLAERLAAAGHECYLVGGTVRDAFLGLASHDVDLTTDARPEEVRAVLDGWADHLWLQGERFGTVGAEKDGLGLEITTYRGDVYRPESRKPFLEMARRYEEIVGDATQSPASRRAAEEAASRWRERARLCRLEARWLGAEPIVADGPPASERGPAYSGPERRKQDRRKAERRSSEPGVVGQTGTASFDRRVNPDRRKGDRRSSWPGAW